MKNKGNEKKKITPVDLFLIFLLVLSVSAIFFRLNEKKITKAELIPLEIKAIVFGVKKETLDCLSLGDPLYTASGELYGIVAQAEQFLSETELQSNGVFYKGVPQNAELWTLVLTIHAQGNQSGDVFLQGGKYPILLGGEFFLYSTKTALNFQIQSVSHRQG